MENEYEVKELKLAHKPVEKPVAKRARAQILFGIDNIIRQIRNCEDYNFQAAWDEVITRDIGGADLSSNVNILDSLDDESFEDIVRVGVQSIFHAFYIDDWERLGTYLHPRKNVLR